MDDESKKQRKKPGPVAGSKSGPERAKTSMEVDVDLIDWGKAQPGGLSELVRRLLREEQTRQSSATVKESD